jgi:hypothetical protein
MHSGAELRAHRASLACKMRSHAHTRTHAASPQHALSCLQKPLSCTPCLVHERALLRVSLGGEEEEEGGTDRRRRPWRPRRRS